MTRSALAHVGSYVVIIAGLLVPAVSYAANSPYDQSGTNPAQSNCDSKTGCANYATGDQTTANPTQPQQKKKTTKAKAAKTSHHPSQPQQQQKQ